MLSFATSQTQARRSVSRTLSRFQILYTYWIYYTASPTERPLSGADFLKSGWRFSSRTTWARGRRRLIAHTFGRCGWISLLGKPRRTVMGEV